MFDREKLFQLLADKDWNNLAEVIYINRKNFKTDLVIQQAINLFESEFFSHIDSLNSRDKLLKFRHIGLIIEENRSAFSNSFVERFIDEKLLALRATDSDALLGFAAHFQDRPLSKKILAELQQKSPEKIASIKHKNISIKSTLTTQEPKKIIKLFKSKQEENFFEAVRRSFPTYHPYPNVALSCVINFEDIRQKLNSDATKYFFRAIIDCVVFDSSKGYEPIYFFELDSVFHENEKASMNDALKNSIFEAANVKLIRIRPRLREEMTVEKLEKLVLEVMR